MQRYVGCAKLENDRATDTVVGATFVGFTVPDIACAATAAVVARVPLSVPWQVVLSHPMPSAVRLRLLEALHTQRRAESRPSGPPCPMPMRS
ncbi:hypothetical protein GCM10011579_064530 [Streptomyces albiflavescens]|uniref:Pyridine nucleotide-disulphide oxidoreductase dimerisation domain-containing protein n=1 Tax=Streptomyces albiflavescens TaxID=1623582 RepID=A0A917Y913_9ACTN|nr:hypothetical protein [Streptomyces albiflavescens]GGN79747.1 hypothetical protein GCM10011579_064530 [Streptomyces albiflavescens]